MAKVHNKTNQNCIEMDEIWKSRYFPKQQGWAILYIYLLKNSLYLFLK